MTEPNEAPITLVNSWVAIHKLGDFGQPGYLIGYLTVIDSGFIKLTRTYQISFHLRSSEILVDPLLLIENNRLPDDINYKPDAYYPIEHIHAIIPITSELYYKATMTNKTRHRPTASEILDIIKEADNKDDYLEQRTKPL